MNIILVLTRGSAIADGPRDSVLVKSCLLQLHWFFSCIFDCDSDFIAP